MYRLYAHFSVNHPLIHKSNILMTFVIFILSCYQLLENNNLAYAIGFILVAIPTLIFARSSDYKRKYLSTNN